MNPRPLCVDCDGTLLRTDLFHEAVFGLLRRKAYLKEQLPDRVSLDPPGRGDQVNDLSRSDAEMEHRPDVGAGNDTQRIEDRVVP